MQALSIRTISSAESVLAMPCQADSDEHLISLWLHGRGRHTQSAGLSTASYQTREGIRES